MALRGDRAAAVSYTFDDALRDHAELAAPFLEMFGFKGVCLQLHPTLVDTMPGTPQGWILRRCSAAGGTTFHRTYSPRYSPVGRTQPTPGNAALPRVSACGLISV